MEKKYSPKFQHLIDLEIEYSKIAVAIKRLARSVSRNRRKGARKLIRAEYSLKDVPGHIKHGKPIKYEELIHIYPVDIVNHILAEFGYVISVKLEKIEGKPE